MAEWFLDYTQLKIYKPPFMFLQFISACQKSSWFMNSYLRYSGNLINQEPFWSHQIYNFHINVYLYSIYLTCKIMLINPAARKIYTWFKNFKITLTGRIFDYAQWQTNRLSFMFLKSISACHRPCWFINSCLRYTWIKNPAIWLYNNIFDNTPLKIFIGLNIQLIQESQRFIGWKHFWSCLTKNSQITFYVSWIYICMP